MSIQSGGSKFQGSGENVNVGFKSGLAHRGFDTVQAAKRGRDVGFSRV